LLYASGATALSKLADVATGNVLISGGVATAPSWGKVALATHVSGSLPLANGGTGLTTAADDTVMVSSGTAWVARALTTGVVSYDTSTNAFSVPTTFILGSGAPTPSADNILLRSNINGLFEMVLGNGSAYANAEAAKLALGNFVDNTFVASRYTTLGVVSTYTGTISTQPIVQQYNLVVATPSADATQPVQGMSVAVTSDDSVRNFVELTAASFDAEPSGSGTVTANTAIYAQGYVSGVGTTTKNAGIEIFVGGADTSIITDNYGLLIDGTSVGMTLTNNYGIYIADQTVASTLNYAFFYAAPSSKEFAIKADGQVIVGALKTTGSASSKKVVCVDTSTGQLYASSTGTDCSN
jgi:hypothetical protein